LWSTHLKPLGHVSDNPWLEVPFPNAPRGKRVRVPDEESVTEFFNWLEKKHPGWELPRLFVLVKMLSGSRTLDLCKVKTADLGPDFLTLTAEATKTREARRVPLPDDLIRNLRRVAGEMWLWERSAEESKQYRPTRGKAAVAAYNPSTWKWTISNLFREFSKSRPNKPRFRPHDLRARAITLTAAALKSLDATALAMGVDIQTARHYFDASKVFDQSELLREVSIHLLPRGNAPESV
jgi:integrase